MKNLLKIAPLVLLLLNIACSSDDGGSGDEAATINFNVTGIWDLVEVNISSAQDINLDNTSSTNLLDELDCVIGTLLIDGDLSWSYEQSSIFVSAITNGQFNAQCSGTITASGTWTADDTQVVFSGSSTLSTMQIDGETLVNNVGDDLPGIQSFVYRRRN
ncbi:MULTISPECIES: hypothetical protein [Flavobacteriaceae]|uniref:hypothetical protein n=1 Tax=Flavobacteriaceae TaxID=49546 RepID=UPI001492DAB8|nr:MULTISPECIES: hypothetical protein [Allomuricauda]MDC6364680.1 hypothetical protein [Muricauda sp. AC10]